MNKLGHVGITQYSAKISHFWLISFVKFLH